MLKMGLPSAVANKNVIKENQNKLSKVGFQEFIQETLEGRWSIAKPKRHYQELIMAFMSSESGLGKICFLHPNLGITGAKIQFGEETGTLELIQQIINDRNVRRTKFAHTRIIQNIWNIVIKSIWTNIYVIRMNNKII
jgi:hypothetical protein